MRILADALPHSKSFVAALGLPAQATTTVLRWLAMVVGHFGKMTATAVAQDLRTQPRHPAQSGRFLQRRFWQRVDVLGAAQRLLLALEGCFGTFVFIVDQTYCGQHGQHTDNTFSTANFRPTAASTASTPTTPLAPPTSAPGPGSGPVGSPSMPAAPVMVLSLDYC